jgi:cytochrome oxidase assembly protein ShyY1
MAMTKTGATAKPVTTASDVRRWLGWLALVVAFSIACVFLSNWQFGRRQEAVGAMTRLDSNYNSAPVALESLEKPWGFRPANEWRQVTLTGHYLPLNALLVRNRPLNGASGFLEVVPFQLTDGLIVLVERGWISSDANYSAPKNFGVPSGETQTVVAHIREQEPAFGGTTPAGQVASINVAKVAEKAQIKDRMFQHLYVRMASESKPQGLLTPLSKPNLDEGNHLSYALQWILFALMAVVALFWAIRKERQARAGVVKTKRKDADSAFEDAQLD